jgi:hypothetical protein
VIDDAAIPKPLTRYMAIDPHPRTPYAHLWVGIDRFRDVYVYRDYWPSKVYGLNKKLKDSDEDPQYTTKEYVEVIARLEGNDLEWHKDSGDEEYGVYVRKPHGEEVVYRYMDQAGKAFKVSGEGTPLATISTQFNKYGMPCMDPYKIHKAGEDAIRLLVQGVKGSRGPLAIGSPLVLHEADGRFTAEAQAIHEGRARIAFSP